MGVELHYVWVESGGYVSPSQHTHSRLSIALRRQFAPHLAQQMIDSKGAGSHRVVDPISVLLLVGLNWRF
jgi:hypothetical protein